ncbi:MAG: lytic transglycosylase domain-containing protein [Owenweeksia sp.]|nr:lytic transglycosylase domain-containing protein [Owenweeksia sp.]
MKKWNALLLFLWCASALAYIPQHGDTDTTKKPEEADLALIYLEDDPYAARLDSLLSYSFFGSSSENFKDNGEIFKDNVADSASAIPLFSDSVLAHRLAMLDERTPFELDFNPKVKRYIEVYANERREQVCRMMGLAEYYFPLFEEALDRNNLPLELKYLAIVESALNPKARSRVGATGLWQFMYATGRLQGLSVSSYVDERCDPIKATQAACEYLQTLYNIFDDWNLALAAYNSGPGNVEQSNSQIWWTAKLLGHTPFPTARNGRLCSRIYCRKLRDELCRGTPPASNGTEALLLSNRYSDH